MTPDAPTLRGTAQNPDVFFQAREAANPFYDAVPGIVTDVFDELAARTGRRYGLVDYVGAPDAERVIVLMGSAAGAATEAVETLTSAGEKVGVVTVRLYRPFPSAALLAALPPTTRSIAVLDRTKEPGAVGEPLYLDVLAALAEAAAAGDLPLTSGMPRVIGGRYGLSSKEFTPAHVAGVFNELAAERPKPHFTVGIYDDVVAPVARRRPRRCATPVPPVRCRRCSSDSAPTAPSARTSRRSRSSASRPTSSPRATSSTTPRSRARSPCRTCASVRGRSARPT